MPHDILLKLLYSSPPSPSPSQPRSRNRVHTARNFKAYIVGCVSVRVLEFLTQVLWLLKFLQKESWRSCLHVRSAIDRFAQSLIHLRVNLVGQSLIYK